MLSNRSATAHDLTAIVEVMQASRAADGIVGEWPPRGELAEVVAQLNPARDIRVWEDEQGAMHAWALLFMPWCNLVCYLLPDARNEQVEAELMSWAVERVQDYAKVSGKTATLDAPARSDDNYRVGLLERHDFVRLPDETLTMTRWLDDALPAPVLPSGFTIRPLAGEQELAAAVDLHRAAYGTMNMTTTIRSAMMQSPAYLPDLDLFAVAPDGELAAFCICTLDADECAVQGRTVGAVDNVGVHPRYRGRGLARALILAGLHGLREHSAVAASLGVASDNAVARALYASLDFQLAHRSLWYQRSV